MLAEIIVISREKANMEQQLESSRSRLVPHVTLTDNSLSLADGSIIKQAKVNTETNRRLRKAALRVSVIMELRCIKQKPAS